MAESGERNTCDARARLFRLRAVGGVKLTNRVVIERRNTPLRYICESPLDDA